MTVKAPDIECQGCANAIKKALGAVPGVSEVSVDIAAKAVMVKHDETAAPRAAILSALDKAGFPAS
jgi:copper chaperone CopZ